MRVTEKQLIFMIQVLRDSLQFDTRFFTFDYETRKNLYDQLINQFDGNLVEIGGLKQEEENG